MHQRQKVKISLRILSIYNKEKGFTDIIKLWVKEFLNCF